MPSNLVRYLIKDEEKIEGLQKKYDCTIEIRAEEEIKVKTAQGMPGRIVGITGSPKACSKALFLFNEELIKIENGLNGQRKI